MPAEASDACSCLLTKLTGTKRLTPPVRSPMKVLSLPLCLIFAQASQAFKMPRLYDLYTNLVLKSEGLKCCSLPKSKLPGFGIHEQTPNEALKNTGEASVKQEAGFWQGFEQVREWQASFRAVATSQELKMQGMCLCPIVDE